MMNGYQVRVPVIIRPCYSVSFERFHGMTWIHCIVGRWSKTVRQNLSDDFEALVKMHNEPIFAIHEIGDTKHEKFLALFKFHYVQDVVGVDGVTRAIYRRN
jgi:hypothetical protein